MVVYSYDNNGVYIGESEAFQDPLEEAEFLIPANATTIAPPTVGADEYTVFNGTAWNVVKARADENQPEPTAEELALMIRAQRDRLLAETDYLLMPDYPIAGEALDALAVYRQALRDITKQETFPQSVTWPEKPEI